MPDYTKTSIYKICCKDATITDIYIGSTCNFTRRKSQHKNNCNKEISKEYNCYKYQFIRDNGGWDNWTMIQLKEFSCENKREKDTEERKHIDELKPSLNKQLPTRTQKQWVETNKEKLKEQRKQYRLLKGDTLLESKRKYYYDNKEKIKEHYLKNKNNILFKEKKREYMKKYYLKKKAEKANNDSE